MKQLKSTSSTLALAAVSLLTHRHSIHQSLNICKFSFFLTSRKRGPDLFFLKLKAWFVTHYYQHGKLGLCIAYSRLVKHDAEFFEYCGILKIALPI